MEFHKRLCELRNKKGSSQNQAAVEIGITLRQYQRFEAGEQKPGFDNLIKIADCFEVSLDWLMGRTEKREINR